MNPLWHKHQFRELALGLLLLLPGTLAWGQSASNWRVYKASDGLPESACISVTFSAFGKVLVRHYNLPYISELDGYTVNRIYAPEAGFGRVYGGAGGQLWTVDPKGLREFRDGAWIFHELPEIAALFAARSPRSIDPLPLHPLRRYAVLGLFPDRLVQVSFDQPGEPGRTVVREVAGSPLETFLSMTPARDGGLWVSGNGGLSRLMAPARNVAPGSQWSDFRIPESLGVSALNGVREDGAGRVVMIGDRAATGEKAIIIFDGESWVSRPAGAERLRNAWFGPDGRVWAATIAALKQAEGPGFELVANEQVSARQFLDVAVEPGGAFWLATSDGLLRYSLLPWRVPSELREVRSLVRSLAADDQGRVWFATGAALQAIGQSGLTTRRVSTEILQGLRGCYPAPNRSLLLETETQLLLLPMEEGPPRPVLQAGPGESLAVLGRLKDGSFCVQRLPAAREGSTYQLENLEGSQVERLPWPPLEAGLGDRLHALCQTRNGDIWVAGDKGVARLRENRWSVDKVPEVNPGSVLHLLETVDGRVLCATRDTVWEYKAPDWLVLRVGFDQINAMMQSRDGSIWVGSNSGLFRFLRGQWVECGTEEGLPDSNVRQLLEDSVGHLWAATTRGLAQFFPEADRDAPQTVIRKLPGNSAAGESGVTLAFAGQDKWKQTPRERLLFSHRIDDHEWSLFGENTEVFLDELSAGKHVFQVRAMDRLFNVEPEPARLEFMVVLPWYQETRLMIIALLGALVALFFAGLAVNRHRKLLRSYASVERKVAERTRELEVASQQLLQSQKMTALGTLAAGVAHDFNNILSVIKGSAQIIEENLDKPDKVRRRLDRIKMVVDQGAGTIRAMLGFSRESDQQPALCDLRDIAEDTIRLLGERLIREAPVRLKTSPNVPRVHGSRDLIQQILFNIVFNAAESMTGEKGILISTGNLEALPAGLVLAPEPASAYAAVSVQDWGCGIPAENLQRIFEPFYTTKALSARRGTGLGLSMVYELAKKIGAGLAVQSAVNEGSTFTLLLPVKDTPPEPAPASSAAQTDSPWI